MHNHISVEIFFYLVEIGTKTCLSLELEIIEKYSLFLRLFFKKSDENMFKWRLKQL